MAYGHSHANIVPTPKLWIHDARDTDLKVPKSMPIVYAQIPFYLNNLGDTEVMVDMIKQVRDVCAKFEEKGLPNFPSGVPFTFWEQYINLRMWLMLALGSILIATFVVTTIAMMSPWIGIIVVVVISSIILQLFGIMGLLDIRLSAVPAVIMIFAVGLGIEFTFHIIMVSNWVFENNCCTLLTLRTHF
jgi:patched 1 protein